MIDVLDRFDANDYAELLIRENTWQMARFQAARLVSLLSCMQTYKIALPTWCRGALAKRVTRC